MFLFPLWERICISYHTFMCMHLFTNSVIKYDMLTAVNNAFTTEDRTTVTKSESRIMLSKRFYFTGRAACRLHLFVKFPLSVYLHKDAHTDSLEFPRHPEDRASAYFGLSWTCFGLDKSNNKILLQNNRIISQTEKRKKVSVVLDFVGQGYRNLHPSRQKSVYELFHLFWWDCFSLFGICCL